MRPVLRSIAPVFLLLASRVGAADVTFDGSIESSGAAAPGGGFTYLIDDTDGEVSGGNLFLSFDTFEVLEGEEAHFASGFALERVLSRITGLGPMRVDGTISSSILGADFFFLSPSGIVIGDGAVIDVPAGLTLSTADNMLFSDGAVFTTELSSSPVLTVAMPTTLRFLASGTGSGIVVYDAAISTPSIRLIGDTVELQDFVVPFSATDVRIAGVAEGDLDLASHVLSGAMGNVAINDSALLIDSEAGETVRIVGEDVVIDRTNVFVTQSTPVVPEDIQIDANSVAITNFSRILSDSEVVGGQGPTIRIAASDSILIDGANTILDLEASADGASSGDAVLRGNTISVTGGAAIEADQFSAAGGSTGDIDIAATASFTLAGSGSALTIAAGGTAQGGEVRIDAPTVLIRDGALVLADSFGDAVGGRIELAGDSITVDSARITNENDRLGGAGIDIAASDVAVVNDGLISTQSFESGPGGSLDINTERLVVDNGGRITVSTLNVGVGGDLTIDASESILIDGTGAQRTTGLFARAGDRDLEPVLGNREGFGEGDGGTITISSPDVRVMGGGVITSDTTRNGDAGDITIDSESLLVSGLGSRIVAETDGAGRAGRIVLGANASVALLSLSEGASITTTTRDAGDAGAIVILAESLELSGTTTAPSISSNSAITDTVSAAEVGGAGTVTIDSDAIVIDGLGRISTDSAGDRLATDPMSGTESTADVVVTARQLVLRGSAAAGAAAIEDSVIGTSPSGEFAGITSNASGAVRGGNIRINATDIVELDGAVVSASASGTGGGGDVIVGSSAEPVGRILIYTDSGLLARAVTGNGGNVFVFTNEFLRDFSSVLSADSNEGNAGTVEIAAPDQNLNAALGNLDVGLLDASSLIRDVCEIRPSSRRSSLTIEGAGGAPDMPDEVLYSRPIDPVDSSTDVQHGAAQWFAASWGTLCESQREIP